MWRQVQHSMSCRASVSDFSVCVVRDEELGVKEKNKTLNRMGESGVRGKNNLCEGCPSKLDFYCNKTVMFAMYTNIVMGRY